MLPDDRGRCRSHNRSRSGSRASPRHSP
jgi:hypothetical protein